MCGKKHTIEKIQRSLRLDNGKRNILFVIHDHWRGGTQLHVQDLVDGLRQLYNCYILSKEGPSLLLSIHDGDAYVDFLFDLNEAYDCTTFTNEEYRTIIKNILIGMNINLVHIHHLLGHTLDIFNEASQLGIPVILTLHDFYFLCPTVNLLDCDLNYCGGVHSTQQCLRCSNKLGYDYDIIQNWRTEVRKVLASSTKIFTPSHSTKDIYCRYYKEIEGKVGVCEHGTVFQKLHYKPRLRDDTFNIAFVGQVSPHKGSNLIYDLIVSNDDPQIKWHLFGDTSNDKIGKIENSQLFKHGAYSRDDVTSLLQEHDINLVCILSIWPETYCYTLTESLLANIPVLVTDIGALGERAKKSGVGWLINPDCNSREFLKCIQSIRNDKEGYEKIVENVANYRIKSVSEMCHEYREVYDNLHTEEVGGSQECIDYSMFVDAIKYADYSRIFQQNSLDKIIEELAAYEDVSIDNIGIYIFGTGQGGRLLLEHIQKKTQYARNIKGFFDNNSSAWGTSLMGVPVFGPTLEHLQKNDVVFIASHTYAEAIKQKLLNMGVPRNKIIYLGRLLRELLMGN